ncbi:hypothetical protein OPAG_07964 [Rhodococcus opacus PD630]|nr:hypothetical protein OPAG_07964 [Rhodococcus opacus PD630]
MSRIRARGGRAERPCLGFVARGRLDAEGWRAAATRKRSRRPGCPRKRLHLAIQEGRRMDFRRTPLARSENYWEQLGSVEARHVDGAEQDRPPAPDEQVSLVDHCRGATPDPA